MKKIIELIIEYFSTKWKNVLTEICYILCISLLLFLSFKYVPHNIDSLKDLNICSYILVICSIRFLLYKDEEDIEEYNNIPQKSNKVSIPLDDNIYFNRQLYEEEVEDDYLPVKNVGIPLYPSEIDDVEGGDVRE